MDPFLTDDPIEDVKSPEMVGEVERVRAALEWFYEGMANRNMTFSYIQLTIALEALLGDPDQTSDVTRRLCDRCSYLIAGNPVERQEITKQLKKAYNVRSTIVHQGKQRLDEKESGYYETLREFLIRSLAKEISFLPEIA